MNYTLLLAPGKTEPIEVEGDFFAVVSSPVDLLIKEGTKEECIFGQGDSRTLPAGERFKYLHVKNPTLNEVTVIIDAGTSRYEQRRQAVIEPKTQAVAHEGILGHGLYANLAPVPPPGAIRRKCITVTNVDPNQPLKLVAKDLTGALKQGQTIFPETSIILPISEDLMLFNASPDPVAYEILEIYWVV